MTQSLQRMKRPAASALDLATATEVAEREGAAAIVAGEVNSAGRGFVLTLRLIDAKSGAELIPLRMTARDSADVINAIDRVSNKLRERIGESYRTLRSGQPLARVTTSSLEALRKYSQGARAIDVEGNLDRGVALLGEAVAMDSGFAMAWRKLGTTLSNQFLERPRAVAAITRAYQHRDRLPERERHLAEYSYFGNVNYDPTRALRAVEDLLALDSLDAYALNNLGVLYSRVTDHSRAETFYRAAVRADSGNTLSWNNLANSLANQGKFKDARATLEQTRSRFPGFQRYSESSGYLEAAQRNYPAAESIFRTRQDSARSNPLVFIQSTMKLAELAAVRGKIGEARAQLRNAARVEEERGLTPQLLGNGIMAASFDVYVRGQPADAVAHLDELLRKYPLSSVHELERPYSDLAAVYAASGKPQFARQLLQEYDSVVSRDLRTFLERALYAAARGALAQAEGRNAEALQELRTAAGGCLRCPLPMMGQAFEAEHQPDSAIAAYELYLATPFMYSIEAMDRMYLGWIFERLAQLYDAKGNTQKAAESYSQFVQLWKDADPELQPRVMTARNRLAQLLAKRG